jgi:hypothetical protein
MSYQSYKATCAIDTSGAATFTREMALKAYSEVANVTYYMLLPEYPPEDEHILDLMDLRSVDSDHEVHPVVEEEQISGRLRLEATIDPPLRPGKELRLESPERATGPLFVFEKEPGNSMDWDYFAWDVSRPTRRLEVSVVFPPGRRPLKPIHDVWYALGLSMIRHDAEYERVARNLEENREGVVSILRLSVEYPILGLTYVIRWDLPD